MPSLTHTNTVSLYKHGLHSLKHILQKAEEHAKTNNIDPETLITASLYPDMLPLRFQVYRTTYSAIQAAYRCTLRQLPAGEDTDRTFDDFYKRIDQALEELESVEPGVVAECEDKKFKAPLGPNKYEFVPAEYVVVYSMPTFFFHLVTAYSILRARGVPLGKLDYIGGFLAPIGFSV